MIRRSVNPFETSRRDKPQYFVDVSKESSTQNMGLSLIQTRECIQQFCVQERMTDVEVKYVDKYPTTKLVIQIKISVYSNG